MNCLDLLVQRHYHLLRNLARHATTKLANTFAFIWSSVCIPAIYISTTGRPLDAINKRIAYTCRFALLNETSKTLLKRRIREDLLASNGVEIDQIQTKIRKKELNAKIHSKVYAQKYNN